ncbi:hypothetical protein BDY21DRAFT_342266 [Lineolata rhizophorae]|uniref:Dienelactone hydrolase domain-containing protein n=1 Tax=Lineolata rhizophorae TaxID=578093 RepID=A0A6A6P3J2_9PEZI|nr:hypothetical protein BDY21DRAFT_342266 [Lineolata rhizophorae]
MLAPCARRSTSTFLLRTSRSAFSRNNNKAIRPLSKQTLQLSHRTPNRPPLASFPRNLSSSTRTMSGASKACCTVPPVVSEGYKEKGEWVTVDGLKTYATGPASAKKGILVIYDIFGFYPQTLQGADILAHGDSEVPKRVFMPDWFEGKPASLSWFPPQTDDQKSKLGAFFAEVAAPPKHVPRVPIVADELKKLAPDVADWGIVGYCWGAKIVNLSSQAGTPFKAAACCHPAMVDPNDASNITIPIAMLPSKDESKDDIAAWQKGLKQANKVEWFEDQIHGFMAARGDLTDANVKQQYERGYKLLLDWFHEQL